MSANMIFRFLRLAVVMATFGVGCAFAAECDKTVSVPSEVAAPFDLTCEYRENPAGIDCAVPRLSWKLRLPTVCQRAYELELDGKPQGRVASDQSLNRPWTGGFLATGSRHTWRVRVWAGDGEPSPWSAPATFTMGVMDDSFWKARWIGPAAATRPDVDFGNARWVTSTTGVLRAVFTLSAIPKAKEMVFLSRTPYELRVNGKRSRGSYEGHVWKEGFAKFHDLSEDELVVGTNTLEFLTLRMKKNAPVDDPAVIAVFREKGQTIGSPAWSKANELGRLHDVPWATNLVLREETAAPAFRKRFQVAKDVRHATLFITGLGFYEASLNGVKIGNKVLDPSPTDYTKRVLYSTYELDGCLRKGENVLDVLVGHGFYDVRLKSVWDNDMATWRDFPRMLAQLELEYADGTRGTVATDDSWRQVKSPLGFDDIREGEVIGGGHVREPAFPAEGFPVAVVPGPAGRLTAENNPPTKILYENRPVRIKPLAGESGAYMVAFPENVAGWIRLKLRGLAAGDIVSVRYDERKHGDLEPAVSDSFYRRKGINTLNRCGKVDGPSPRLIDCHFKTTGSLNFGAKDRAFQTDHYIASGRSEETYEPRFTYNGFQYVLIRGLKTPLRDGDVVQCVVSTDFRTVAEFASSDPTLNRLMRAAARTYRANFTVCLPTDCPHREKNGWTGDASVASRFAQFQFENTSGYEKWLRDIVDAQDAKGDLPGIVPSPGWGFAWGNGPVWDSALYTVAWNLYRYRDDRMAVEMVYPALVRYLAFTETKADAEGIVNHGLGDWIPPKWDRIPSIAFTSSCHFMEAHEIAAKMAKVLERPDEYRRFADRAAVLRRAIRRRFMKKDGTFDNGGQTAQSSALVFGLADETEIATVGKRLLEAVHRREDHLETGVVGCKTLFRALSNLGRTDLALKLILRPDAPSYGAWFKDGSETFWEDWGDGASRNHIMFGDVAAWVYEYVLGIRLAPDANAFRRFVIRPGWTCGLEHASGRIDTPLGELRVSWRKGAGLEVLVPPGSSCTAESESGSLVTLGPGHHHVDGKCGSTVSAGGLEFIAPPVEGHVHASTVLPVAGGYLAAWFEGVKESAEDVSIWGATRQNGRWGAKRLLAKVNPESAHWNPVLRRADDGRICLYFKVGRNCADWRTYTIESRDDGRTWSTPRELVPGDVMGGRGPVKNKCLRLTSGRWLAGASREFDPAKLDLTVLWRSFVDISDDDGRTWRRTEPFPIPTDAPPWGRHPFGVIQPTLWEDASGVHALMRATDGWIWRTDSKDGGETWSVCRRSPLENINSGIDCVRASDGKLYLALNGVNRDPKSKNWGSRNHLELKVSADGGSTWKMFRTLADDTLVQKDGRSSEYSYPALIEARPGVLALTFTYNRHQIAFCEIAVSDVGCQNQFTEKKGKIEK